MQFLKKCVAMIMLMSVVGFVVVVVSPQPARGVGFAPVTVVNTPGHPVPVTGVVTGHITGDVNAGQRGPWNVGIIGTPTVQVGNTSGSPVLTRDVDRAAKQSFHTTSFTFMIGGEQNKADTFTVPAGKQFVIELVAAQANILPGQRALITLTPGNGSNLPIPLTDQGTYNGGTLEAFVGTQQTNLSFDPGTNLTYIYNRTAGEGDAGFFVTLWGYLVDVP